LNASAALQLAWHGAVIPAIAALAAFFTIGWLWPSDVVSRYRAGAAFAVGIFVGFVLLPSTSSLIPSEYVEWIPYLGLLAALAAGLTLANGVLRWERWVAIYLVSFAAALLIVPTWPELAPARPIQIAVLAIGMTTLAALLLPLPERLPGAVVPSWLLVAAAATSGLILLEQSETVGRPAALPAGALAGCIAAATIVKSPVAWSGLIFPYAVVAGGYAYLGAIYPVTPLWSLLIMPIAPLALWISVVGPWAQTSGLRALILQSICVLTPIVIVAAILISRSAGGDEW
jgi:hypothetical protein